MPTPPPIVVTTVPSLPPRAPDSHKGDFGRVLLVAGSRGMSGAAVLCGSAALRRLGRLWGRAAPSPRWIDVPPGPPPPERVEGDGLASPSSTTRRRSSRPAA